MNLARRILEGIHEVELDIAPEFQKEPDQPGTFALHQAFKDNGWKMSKHFQHGTDLTYTYEHPELPGASMQFTVDVPTSTLHHQMLVKAESTSDPMWMAASPTTVDNITKDWLAIEKKNAPAKDVSIGVIEDTFKEVGWQLVKEKSAHGGRELWFAHVGVTEYIIVLFGPDDKPMSARIHKSYNEWTQIGTQPNQLRSVAYHLNLEYGFDGPSDEPSPERMSKAVRMAVESIDGWEMKKAKSGGGRSYFSKMVFKYPGADQTIEVSIGKKGEIVKAVMVHPDGSGNLITPNLDSIMTRAKAIKSWTY